MWRHGILLSKIVDGRFQRIGILNGENGALVNRYGPTFHDLIQRRIGKWKSKRDKKLLGMDAPDPIFLV